MINRIITLLSILTLTMFISCSPKTKQENISKESSIEESLSKGNNHDLESFSSSKNPILQAVLWQQLSGEYHAICYQTYQFAQLRFDNILKVKKFKTDKPKAIILDLDETVVDNSPFYTSQIKEKREFSEEAWTAWVKKEKAELLPGAFSFLNYVADKQVTIFYVSNRNVKNFEATFNNLKKKSLPFVDKDHILLKEDTSDKEKRRLKVLKTHEVILYLGDNLSDFSNDFNIQSNTKRNARVDSLHASFGERNIIFPNPIYGNWEKDGLFHGHFKWTNAEKDSIRLASLRAD